MLRLGALPALSACHAALPHPPYAAQDASALSQVDFAPPPGRVETIPPRPREADAWIDGEWIQRRGRWHWLAGRWVMVPAGARYAPWVAVRAADGTAYFAPGAWRGARGEPIPDPPALAVATVSTEAVSSPEGDPEPTGSTLTPGTARPINHP
jgi:hypothetical protein